MTDWLRKTSLFAECLADTSVVISAGELPSPPEDEGSEEDLIEYRSRFHRTTVDAEWRVTIPAFVKIHLFSEVPELPYVMAIFQANSVRLMSAHLWRSTYLSKQGFPRLPAGISALPTGSKPQRLS